ncbi:MAG: DUF373 family protein [Nitrososphaeria archaeon]
MSSVAQTRLLVLCVDRDNDLYEKTSISSPVIGRAACLKAAEALALADPEEADANAIFAAIKEYDTLKSHGFNPEIAIVTGKFAGGVESDTKVRNELLQVKKTFPAEGIVFVSDGFEDEYLLPIVQAVTPIFSIRRVIIKHSGRVEESYIVLGKYFKMLIFDPRYSKYFLGVPGLFLIIFGSLILVGYVNQAMLGALFFVGILLMMRGFGIDTLIRKAEKLSPSSYIRIFSVLGMILMFIVAFYRGFTAIGLTSEYRIVSSDPSRLPEFLSFLSGVMMENAILYMWMGAGIYYMGHIFYTFIRESLYRAFRYTVGIITLVLLYPPLIELSQVLKDPTRSPFSVVSTLLIGLALLFVILSFAYLKITQRRTR